MNQQGKTEPQSKRGKKKKAQVALLRCQVSKPGSYLFYLLGDIKTDLIDKTHLLSGFFFLFILFLPSLVFY